MNSSLKNCPSCKGKGQIKCPACKGKGRPFDCGTCTNHGSDESWGAVSCDRCASTGKVKKS